MDVTEEVEQRFDEWCVVVFVDRVRRAGRLTERKIAGTNFLQLDIPTEGTGSGFTTQFINPRSIYEIIPIAEDTARGFATHAQLQPIHPWELPPAPALDDGTDEGSLIEGAPF